MAERVCTLCTLEIPSTEDALSSGSRNFHMSCFTCAGPCQENLVNATKKYFFREPIEGQHEHPTVICEPCYLLNRPDCGLCEKKIGNSNFIESCGKCWHPECFRCFNCEASLSDAVNVYEHNDHAYCRDCFFAEKGIDSEELSADCGICKKTIDETDRKIAAKEMGLCFHYECFKCSNGEHQIESDFCMVGEKLLCGDHLRELKRAQEEARASKLRRDPKALALIRKRMLVEFAEYEGKEDPAFDIAKSLKGDQKFSDPNFTPESMLWINGPHATYENWLDYTFDRFPAKSKLCQDGFTPSDISQGALGDCYFLSAIAVLCNRPDLLDKVFCCPVAASLDYVEEVKSKRGVFAFKFYKNGEPRIVVVDNIVPIHPLSCKPAFGRSSDPKEMWVSLLEKAYAKLHGSYEAIIGGFTDEALADLTGGLPFRFRFADESVQADILSGALWTKLKGYYEDGFLLGAGSPAGSDTPENASEDGIVQGHAYAVIQVREASGHRLVQLRNPWGHKEWSGAWSDGSKEWTPEMIQELNQTVEDDGCFWMNFEDFVATYSTMFVCRFFDEKKWPFKQEIDGAWKGESAGGCINFATVRNSPQYSIEVSGDSPVSVVINCMQEEVLDGDDNQVYLPLGMMVFSNYGERITKTKMGKQIAVNIEKSYVRERDGKNSCICFVL